MKIFGSFTELLSLVLRKNSNTVTVQPNTATASVGNVVIELPAKTTGTSTLVDTDTTQTLTNKTMLPASNNFGVTGDLVGDDDVQTLTNKTIVAASNTISGLLHGTQVDNPAVAHGATGAIVGTTNSQVLTNKTLTSPLVSGAIQSAEIATPSTPPSSSWKEYFKTDGKYILDDAGIETKLESALTPDLNDLGDVVITGAASGEVLTFDGADWVNDSVVQSLNDLSDVIISAPASNQSLEYNGSNWVNRGYNYAISTTAATQISTDVNYADVTNAVVSITTTGGPVRITLIPSLGDTSYVTVADTNDEEAGGLLNVVRDGSTSMGPQLLLARTDSTSGTDDPSIVIPTSSYSWIDPAPSAGAHTYQLRFAVLDNGDSMAVDDVKIMVEELK